MPTIDDLLIYGTLDFIINALIYLALALPFFIVFWKVWNHRFRHRRIQERQRSDRRLIRHELKHSASTLLIFAVVDVSIYAAYAAGYTRLYTDVDEYGWGYFAFSVVLMILLHDAWFYFTHRYVMHHPRLFNLIHSVHHRSVDPSPFAAFSFHPLEALIETGVYVVFAFLFPVNLWALYVWQVFQMAFNVIGHLGYEIYPRGFNTHRLFKWKTPSLHHNLHHSHFSGNYGLYFTWWDRIFRTEFKDYHDRYERLQDRISEHRDGAV
jgi:sterol desaturase/sphingolipid hydroxylase (fatty acid hydroxylase superfamily)